MTHCVVNHVHTYSSSRWVPTIHVKYKHFLVFGDTVLFIEVNYVNYKNYKESVELFHIQLSSPDVARENERDREYSVIVL